MGASLAITAAGVLGAFAISAAVTAASIGYARRRRLIDEPGRRRSHSEPTPRGGGIAIVLAVLVCVGPAVGVFDPALPALALALVVVAAIGWIDDHRPLHAGLRLAAHVLAALILLASLIVLPPDVRMIGSAGMPAAIGVLGLLIVWSINLHNFMDGINGLLATQAMFVLAACSALLFSADESGYAAAALVCVAAVAGFLPFNFPRARIFMGDVGSGALGLLIAVFAIAVAALGPAYAASVLIACSAFVVDATATLLSRMLRGRRWYSAHREHLYQWLVRCGRSHRAVVGWYMGWNLVVVAPALYWIHRRPWPDLPAHVLLQPGTQALVAVYSLALVLWWSGKRHCLKRAARRN